MSPLPVYPDFNQPGPIAQEANYGILLRMTPGDTQQFVEIQRAPDSGGAAGTYVTIAKVGPFPINGGVYFDPRPSDASTWWYRARHVGRNYSPGAYAATNGFARHWSEEQIAAQTLGAHEALYLRSDVRGHSEVTFGSVTRFPVNRHVEQPLSLNAAAENFAVDYENIPEIIILPTIYLLPGANSTNDRVIECRAQSVSVSGFTSRAVISTGSSSSPESEDPSDAQNGTTAATVTLTTDLDDAFWNLAGATVESTTYTCPFTISTPGSSPALRHVRIYRNNGAADTDFSTLVASRSYSQGLAALNDSLSFEAEMGANYDLKIVFDHPGGSGGIGDELIVGACTYNAITGGSESSLTPGGSELQCLAREKS